MKKMKGGKMKKMMQQMGDMLGQGGMPDMSQMPGFGNKKFPF